jgi:hypothetical protein
VSPKEKAESNPIYINITQSRKAYLFLYKVKTFCALASLREA